jgi:hypothetical protein
MTCSLVHRFTQRYAADDQIVRVEQALRFGVRPHELSSVDIHRDLWSILCPYVGQKSMCVRQLLRAVCTVVRDYLRYAEPMHVHMEEPDFPDECRYGRKYARVRVQRRSHLQSACSVPRSKRIFTVYLLRKCGITTFWISGHERVQSTLKSNTRLSMSKIITFAPSSFVCA